MLSFRDFKPATAMLGFSTKPFSTAVDAANEWLTATPAVEVVSLETLHHFHFEMPAGKLSVREGAVRVWFRPHTAL